MHAADAATPNILEETNERDLFKKYQEIRHQDFGEIVFRKQKRSRKRYNKGKLMSNTTCSGVVGRLVGCTVDLVGRCSKPRQGTLFHVVFLHPWKMRLVRPTHFNSHLLILFVYV